MVSQSNTKDYQIMVGVGKSKLLKGFIKLRYIPKISTICAKHNLGFTIMDAIGGYSDKDTYTVEYSLVVHISNVSDDTVHTLAEEIRSKLKQKAVLLRAVNAQNEFLTED